MKADPASDRNGARAYEGEYYDALGHRGQIKLRFGGAGAAADSDCEIVLAGEHEPVTFAGPASAPFAMPLDAASAGTQARYVLEVASAALTSEDTTERTSVEATLTLHARTATPYALHALFGIIEVTGDPGLAGGVWIAWQYGE